MSFSRWLRQQRDRADPIGDLSCDFISDKQARGIRTPMQLLTHLIQMGACPEARRALREASREYREEFRRPAKDAA